MIIPLALLALPWTTAVLAEAPSYGNLVIQSKSAEIYEGASLNSKDLGTAMPGDTFALRGDKLYHGFYKIEYDGHVAFIQASAARLRDGQSRTHREADAEQPAAEPRSNSRPTENPAAQPEPGPSAGPERQQGEGMIPSGQGMRPRPLEAPAPLPLPNPEDVIQGVREGVEIAHAFRDAITAGRQRRRDREFAQPLDAPAKPTWNGLGFWRINLGLGLGKFMLVQPAFKPNASAGDTRAVEGSSFVGLGLEVRPISFWRFFADVSAHNHSTRAADMGRQAYAVEVPGLTTAVFPNTDVYYRMDTTSYRLGTRFSLPFRRVEPWLGGAMAWYSWKAMYTDASAGTSYGSDSGLDWGLEAHGGLDIKFGRRPLWILTLFYEYGAAREAPRMENIGGSGATWKDHYGTWVEAPQRVGMMFGVEW